MANRKGTTRADGMLGGSRPGTSDVLQPAEGRWDMAGKALRVNPAGAAPQEVPVVSLSPDRLVLKKR